MDRSSAGMKDPGCGMLTAHAQALHRGTVPRPVSGEVGCRKQAFGGA